MVDFGPAAEMRDGELLGLPVSWCIGWADLLDWSMGEGEAFGFFEVTAGQGGIYELFVVDFDGTLYGGARFATGES